MHRSADNAETAHDVRDDDDIVDDRTGNRAHPMGFSRANLPPAGQTVDYHATPCNEEHFGIENEVTRQPANGVGRHFVFNADAHRNEAPDILYNEVHIGVVNVMTHQPANGVGYEYSNSEAAFCKHAGNEDNGSEIEQSEGIMFKEEVQHMPLHTMGNMLIHKDFVERESDDNVCVPRNDERL